MTHFICWQPVLTDHQAHTLAALADAASATITTIAVSETVAGRAGQNWQALALPGLMPEILPARGWLARIRAIIAAHPQAVHIVGSPFGDRRITLALLLALRSGGRVFLISEPWSPVATGYFGDGGPMAALKARLRPLLYRAYGRLIRRRLAGVFAISPLAIAQYRRIGIPPARIHPFGYFVPGSADPLPPRGGPLRLCFVGALIPRKGVPMLIAAARAARAAGADLELDIFGPGDPQSLGLDDPAIRHAGLIPFGTAPATIARYDALVVPSQHDGWGVVVNEALIANTPVLATTTTGAAAIIATHHCGATFPSDDVATLTALLIVLAANRPRLHAMCAAAIKVAPLLSPATAGAYMHSVIAGERPENPWYTAP